MRVHRGLRVLLATLLLLPAAGCLPRDANPYASLRETPNVPLDSTPESWLLGRRVLSQERLLTAGRFDPMPAYPRQALRARETGPVVFVVATTNDQAAPQIRVLEAPHHSLANAVREASRRWSLPKQPGARGGSSRRAAGKLVLYFLIDERGNGAVRWPDQVDATMQAFSDPVVRPSDPITLDIGERGERPGAHADFRIPADELPYRARIELPRRPVVVDCRTVRSYACDFAEGALTALGFRLVVARRDEGRPIADAMSLPARRLAGRGR